MEAIKGAPEGKYRFELDKAELAELIDSYERQLAAEMLSYGQLEDVFAEDREEHFDKAHSALLRLRLILRTLRSVEPRPRAPRWRGVCAGPKCVNSVEAGPSEFCRLQEQTLAFCSSKCREAFFEPLRR